MNRNNPSNPIADYRKRRYAKPTWGAFIIGLIFFLVVFLLFNSNKDYRFYDNAELTFIIPSQTSSIDYDTVRYRISETNSKEQLNKKLSIIEAIHQDYKEKNYTVMERIGEGQIEDMDSLQYMYKKSKAFKEMVSRDLYDIMPSYIDIEKEYDSDEIQYERITFYVSEPATLVLNISYSTQQGNMGILLVSPKGEGVHSIPATGFMMKTFLSEADKGLWSLIISYDPEEGAVLGDLNIDGTLVKEFDRMEISKDIIYPDEPAVLGPWPLNDGDYVAFNGTMNENGSFYTCRMGVESRIQDGYFSTSSRGGNSPDIHFNQLLRGIYQEEDYLFVLEATSEMSDIPIENLQGEIIVYKKID